MSSPHLSKIITLEMMFTFFNFYIRNKMRISRLKHIFLWRGRTGKRPLIAKLILLLTCRTWNWIKDYIFLQKRLFKKNYIAFPHSLNAAYFASAWFLKLAWIYSGSGNMQTKVGLLNWRHLKQAIFVLDTCHIFLSCCIERSGNVFFETV